MFLLIFSLILNVKFVSVDIRQCRQQPSYHNFSNAFQWWIHIVKCVIVRSSDWFSYMLTSANVSTISMKKFVWKNIWLEVWSSHHLSQREQKFRSCNILWCIYECHQQSIIENDFGTCTSVRRTVTLMLIYRYFSIMARSISFSQWKSMDTFRSLRFWPM